MDFENKVRIWVWLIKKIKIPDIALINKPFTNHFTFYFMKIFTKSFLISSLFIILISCNNQKKSKDVFMPDGAILSAIKGEHSKLVKISFNNSDSELKIFSNAIEGENANFFKIESSLPDQINANQTIDILISFHPEESFTGIAYAEFIIKTSDNSKFIFPLRGLSTKALEGKNEPPLVDVVNTLGFKINLGWTSLANHVKPDLQGDEIASLKFVKAEDKLVEMIPVARYSPPFELPFGYYFKGDSKPELHEVGILANSESYPEHQTLYPALKSGSISFDPRDSEFGFYTTSPSHDAFSEDVWNAHLFKEHVAHACRIYPIKDASGTLLPNQYLVCFEEASNGDYQDYVFVVKNIRPVASK